MTLTAVPSDTLRAGELGSEMEFREFHLCAPVLGGEVAARVAAATISSPFLWKRIPSLKGFHRPAVQTP